MNGFMVLPSFFPAALILIAGPEEGEEPSREEAVLRLIQIRLATPSLEKISLLVKRQM
jgi:hypothetical protein